MNKNLSNIQLKSILYVITAIAAVYLVGYVVTLYWTGKLNTKAAENHAHLVELRGQLQNLPRPNQLQIGVTSGNADEMISRYQSVLKTMDSNNLQKARFLTHGWSSGKTSELNNNTATELSRMATEFREMTDILVASKKFLQYNPQIDLSPIVDGQETDSTERVNRTADGIQATVDELSKIKTANAKKISDIIEPLVAKVRAVTASNAPEWYELVQTAQQNIVKIINDDFVKQLADDTQILTELSQKYLELRS